MLSTTMSRRVSLPFLIYLIVFFSIGGYYKSSIYSVFFIASVICLALIYVFQHQIDMWWWKRNPPPLSPKLKSWVKTFSLFHRQLSPAEQERFERRISLFIKDKNFTLKLAKDFQLEEDTKATIAHEFVRLTFYQDDFLFAHYDQFIIYEHPFGSPNIRVLHSGEMHYDDGVVILSREQLINGFVDSVNYVNVALYIAISCWIRLHPRMKYPSVIELDLEEIAQGHNIALLPVQAVVGSEDISRLNLLIYCYIQYPERNKVFDLDRHQALDNLFGPAAAAISPS